MTALSPHAAWLARIVRANADGDMTVKQLAVLLALADGHTTIRGLTTHLGAVSGSSYRAVGSQVRQGFVSSVCDPDDGRKMQIRLTDHGRSYVALLEQLAGEK